jgi:hypothetical protein
MVSVHFNCCCCCCCYSWCTSSSKGIPNHPKRPNTGPAPRRRRRDTVRSGTNIVVVLIVVVVALLDILRFPNGDNIFQHARHFRDDIHGNQTPPLGAAAAAARLGTTAWSKVWTTTTLIFPVGQISESRILNDSDIFIVSFEMTVTFSKRASNANLAKS